MSTLDRARNAIDLLAAMINAPVRGIEHAILGEDFIDGRTPAREIAFSEKHNLTLENVFDVQDEIGCRAVESLESRFSLSPLKARDRYRRDPEAYGEFMAGLRESASDLTENKLASPTRLRRESNPKTRTRNIEFIHLYSADFARAEELAKRWLLESSRILTLLTFRCTAPCSTMT